MAYPKITVNTGSALEIIASNTIPIPAPGIPVQSGTATAIATNKLISVFGNFDDVVSVGDIVYNTTPLPPTSATVVAVESSTTLELSADIFDTQNQVYKIFLGGPNGSSRINSAEGCLLYVGTTSGIVQNQGGGAADTRYVDVKVKSVSGSVITFKKFKVGEYLPIQVLQLYETGTSTAARTACIAIW